MTVLLERAHQVWASHGRQIRQYGKCDFELDGHVVAWRRKRKSCDVYIKRYLEQLRERLRKAVMENTRIVLQHLLHISPSCGRKETRDGEVPRPHTEGLTEHSCH